LIKSLLTVVKAKKRERRERMRHGRKNHSRREHARPRHANRGKASRPCLAVMLSFASQYFLVSNALKRRAQKRQRFERPLCPSNSWSRARRYRPCECRSRCCSPHHPATSVAATIIAGAGAAAASAAAAAVAAVLPRAVVRVVRYAAD